MYEKYEGNNIRLNKATQKAPQKPPEEKKSVFFAISKGKYAYKECMGNIWSCLTKYTKY